MDRKPSCARRRTHYHMMKVRRRIFTGNKRGKWLFFIVGVLFLVMAGCGSEQRGESVPAQIEGISKGSVRKEDGQAEDIGGFLTESIVSIYCDIYGKARITDAPGNPEIVESIIEKLGEAGYAAVDERNQFNMTKSEKVLEFCNSVEGKEEAKETILVVKYSGGLIKYDLCTVDGQVEIIRGEYSYENGQLENMGTASYPADFWQYTEEGYLLFEGNYFSESYYALLLSEVAEHTALRVLPLEERCRALNRKYILLVGYERNNLFLTEWSEDDFGELDFYDLFDRLYPEIYGQRVSYPVADDVNTEGVCQIPEEQFEGVIRKYFRIDSRRLRERATYLPAAHAYEYRPRGLYEAEYPEIPYSEVEKYVENRDGTITLIVNGIYPEDHTSRAFTHEVVVRPLDEGGFQYVSNHMIFPEDGYDAWWHSERLAEEQ